MEITIRDDYIKLGQALKLAGLAENGAHAKELIAQGAVTVNGEVDLRRGRKCRAGDVIACGGKQVTVQCL